MRAALYGCCASACSCSDGALVEFDRFESFDLAALDVNAIHAPMRSVHHFGVVQNGFAEIKRTRKLEFVLAL